MKHTQQLRIPATYMRGGTSKGVFFRLQDLPAAAQQAGPQRDRLLQRVLGSPDPYGKQIDGMGGASSSTSKVVIVSPSTQRNHDVDYLFGQVSVDRPLIDWSGNCGNLTAAAAAFAIHSGFIADERLQNDGTIAVRIWQKNIEKTIVAYVPIADACVQESGDFSLDGVTFPAAAIELEFLEPSGVEQLLLPTGNLIDELELSNDDKVQRHIECTLINAGIPTIFIRAQDLNLTGTELERDINSEAQLLQLLEEVRAQGALRMGLIEHLAQAAELQHTPKIVWIAPPTTYITSSNCEVTAANIDLCARALSMGKLHHAMMASAAVAIASAAAIPGTLVQRTVAEKMQSTIRVGHPSGTLNVGASAHQDQHQQWQINIVTMQRSARILMEGWVRIPQGDND